MRAVRFALVLPSSELRMTCPLVATISGASGVTIALALG